MKKAFLIAGMILAVSFMGCSKSQKTDTAANQSEEGAQGVVAEAPTASCEVTFDSDMTEADWSDANNDFGLAMLREIAADQSTVFSPYSIERAMGMVLDGGCGATAAELRAALKLPDGNKHGAAGLLVEKKMLASQNDSQIIDIDNHLWVEQKYTLLDSYINRMKSDYSAEPTSLDFVNDADKSRNTINQYITEKTHDRIHDILPDGSINSLTRLVLTNAVYFKAPWEISFNPDMTRKADFVTSTGTIQVDMMHHSKDHRVYLDDSLYAIDLDFQNSPFTFMVILPKVGEDGDVAAALGRVETELTAHGLREIREKMMTGPVSLDMPKFKLEGGSSIRAIFEKFGVHTAFGHADFSGMSGVPDLYLSDVFHKAFIEVDEKGAEAAAATAAVMMKRTALPPRPIEIKVDHPFLFSIIERKTGTALFFGRITKI